MTTGDGCCEGHNFCSSALQELTVEQFVDRYERPRIPVVITGLCDGWRAASAWRQPDLLERYGDHKFKVLQGCLLCLG